MQARVECREKAAALDERLLTFDWVELILSYLARIFPRAQAVAHKRRRESSGLSFVPPNNTRPFNMRQTVYGRSSTCRFYCGFFIPDLLTLAISGLSL